MFSKAWKSWRSRVSIVRLSWSSVERDPQLLSLSSTLSSTLPVPHFLLVMAGHYTPPGMSLDVWGWEPVPKLGGLLTSIRIIPCVYWLNWRINLSMTTSDSSSLQHIQRDWSFQQGLAIQHFNMHPNIEANVEYLFWLIYIGQTMYVKFFPRVCLLKHRFQRELSRVQANPWLELPRIDLFRTKNWLRLFFNPTGRPNLAHLTPPFMAQRRPI